MLNDKKRYLQIAFNGSWWEASSVLPLIPHSDRILIEAGTPFIKREGMAGVARLKGWWGGQLVADMKTLDGGEEEVDMAAEAGATAITVAGAANVATLNKFVEHCEIMGLDSMIDMIGIDEPMKKLVKLKKPPTVVILHRARDEESVREKVIQYKHVNKIKSKYDVFISAAGGIGLREARSAIFNGADIVVVNLVSSVSGWTGIELGTDVAAIANEFLQTIE